LSPTAPIEIAYLAHHRHLASMMAQAFIMEWPGYYGPGGEGDAPADVHACCHKDRLPIGLVAVDVGRFRGAAILRSKTESHAHLGPWLTALMVVPAHRQQGIGTRLIGAAERLAFDLGYDNLYARTGTAVPLFTRLGWDAFDTITSGNQSLTVFRKDSTD
jgi:GNAT superfamily N-acetyltransferase